MKQKISLYIQPNARQTGLAGYFDGKPKIKIKSPAQDNQANTELISFLAKKLNLPKSNIEISAGNTNRHKTVSIESELSKEQILEMLS